MLLLFLLLSFLLSELAADDSLFLMLDPFEVLLDVVDVASESIPEPFELPDVLLPLFEFFI